MVNSGVVRRSIDDRRQPRFRCLLPTSFFSLLPRLSPLLAILTKSARSLRNLFFLTALFSVKLARSFALFLTLKQIRPVFATLTKRRGGIRHAPRLLFKGYLNAVLVALLGPLGDAAYG